MSRYVSVLLISSMALLSACDRLSAVGHTPDFNSLRVYEAVPEQKGSPLTKKDSTDAPGNTGVTSNALIGDTKNPNSLWRAGSRTFFRDQRARAVGDILKVVVSIQDSAKMDSKTSLGRQDKAAVGFSHLFGLETLVRPVMPKSYDPTKAVDVNSSDNSQGEGKIDRKETITTTVAAMVVQILPSNNLVIRGSQEVRVNYELREVTIEGVVRPEDISAENSVTLDQIAEARVSYGGRGNISDRQQERYGKQVLDIIAPF